MVATLKELFRIPRNPAGIKLIFGNIDPDKTIKLALRSRHRLTSQPMKGKAGTKASRPILQRDKDSMIQPTYYGSQRLGTYCNESSNTQEVACPPAFP